MKLTEEEFLKLYGADACEKELKAFNKFCDSVNACVNSGGITRVDLQAKEQVEKALKDKEKQDRVLDTIKELFIFDFALRYPTNQPMLMITNNLTFDYWEIPISQEKHDLLKEILYVQKEENRT